MMNVLYLLSGYDGCGYYRVELPAKYLNKLPDVHAKITTTYTKEDIDWADLMVLQRQVNQKALPYVQYAKSKGKKIITEVDDDYFNIPVTNPAYKHYHDKAEDIINFYKASDAITVSTDYLGRQLSKYNEKVYTVPNSFYFPLFERFQKMDEEEFHKHTVYLTPGNEKISLEDYREMRKDKIVFGWGGSATHLKDLEQATDAIIKLCSENENVMIVMMAVTTDRILEYVSPTQLVLIKPVPIFLYHQVLQTMDWDFAICPIEENTFNKSKSNLKFIEFSNAGFPCICSDVENYAKTVKDRETGLLTKNTEEDWYEKLYEMVNNAALRNHIKKNAKEFVKEKFDMANNYKHWLDAYNEVMSN
jgi:glycosyltransferase involved in cell wall biosynthesis